MAFTDPLVLDIGASTVDLPRIIASTNGTPSIYQSADAEWIVKAQTTVSGRRRHLLRVDTNKWIESELTDGANVNPSMSAYLVVDRPFQLSYYTNADALAVATALMDLASASSYAILTKLLGGES